MLNAVLLEIDGFKNSEQLAVKSFSYHAKLNMPYKLELLCKYKGKEPIATDQLFNRNVTVTLTNGNNKRCFNGIIVQCEQFNASGVVNKLSISKVQLSIVPTFAMMAYYYNTRVFPSGTLLSYLQSIAKEYDITLGEFSEEKLIKRGFCIQYNESDLDFINRLVESESIFYYFKQSGKQTILQLGSSSDNYMGGEIIQLGKGDGKVDYTSVKLNNVLLAQGLTVNDYNYEYPEREIQSNSKSSSQNTFYKKKPANYVSHFPVRSFKDYNDMNNESGADFSENMLKSLQANSETIEAEVENIWNDFDLCRIFKVDGNETEYVITEHNIEISLEDTEKTKTSTTIKGTDRKNPCLPLMKTPIPRVPTQTAVVVGTNETGSISCNNKGNESGEKDGKAEADRNILVRVKFNWDINTKHTPENEECSCWIRVVQPWAGNNRGFIFVPRVGDEVTVMFESGHPDVPMIIGSAYNGENKLPYSLKDNTNVSGIVSRTVPNDSRSSAILMKDDKSSIELNLLTAGNQVNVISKDSLRQVDENVTEHIKKDVNFTIDGSRKEKIGKSLVIEAGESICFKVGGNFVEINQNKVIIVGKQAFGNSGDAAPAGEPAELPEQKPIV